MTMYIQNSVYICNWIAVVSNEYLLYEVNKHGNKQILFIKWKLCAEAEHHMHFIFADFSLNICPIHNNTDRRYYRYDIFI